MEEGLFQRFFPSIMEPHKKLGPFELHRVFYEDMAESLHKRSGAR